MTKGRELEFTPAARDRVTMGRWVGLVVLLSFAGCEAPGVGDPCVPRAIPADGFAAWQTLVEETETCDTGLCVVYQLSGVPFGAREDCDTIDEAGVTPHCGTPTDTTARVYCTCRCDAPPEALGTLCGCPTGDGPDDPDGYSCVELDATGSYCIRNGTFDPSRIRE